MNKTTEQLNYLLNTEQFDQARTIIDEQIKECIQTKPSNQLFLQLELYCFLIDIGCVTMHEADILRGIKFLEENEVAIQKIITKASYYYNLANAKQGLCGIFYSNNRGVHPISLIAAKFQQPINLFWMAYKQNDYDTSMLHQILINLSNSLMGVFRIIEAIQMLDIVLLSEPAFPQALIARAKNLTFLSYYTNSPLTVALFAQIYLSYEMAIQTGNLPPTVLQTSVSGMAEAVKSIESYGFSLADIAKEIEETKKEHNSHTAFRKFCIEKFLTLNEHSIYCNCIATSKDELQIGITNVLFKGQILPQLELLLNRIKSEFAFARWNYYRSETEEAFDYDVHFSELLEGEIINSQTESLRTSYRICYGILDKIALGICKLYKVEGGNIFFERFWNDKDRKPVLETQRNIHLNALFSIACDLNTKTGELRHFKNWRNKLEHNLLILKDTNIVAADPLKVLDDENFVAVVDIDEFKQKALQLLQVTRAAIFSFVYCVRLETITERPTSDNENSFTIALK
jgi:hypothetical protein